MINDIKEEMDIPHVDSCAWNLLLIGYLENRIEQLEAIIEKLVGDLYEKDQP